MYKNIEQTGKENKSLLFFVHNFTENYFSPPPSFCLLEGGKGGWNKIVRGLYLRDLFRDLRGIFPKQNPVFALTKAA